MIQSWCKNLIMRLCRLGDAYESHRPKPPAGASLSPSEADFVAYDDAPLALAWRKKPWADAAAWQEEVRGKLFELTGLRRSSCPDSSVILGAEGASGSLRRRTYYLPNGPRRHIPVTAVWDDQFENSFCPVMICLQGHTSGAHLSWGQTLFPGDRRRIENGGDYALQAVRHGHVAFCIEQIAFGARSENVISHRWQHPCIDASNRALLLGRTLLGDRVSDVMTTIDWLMTDIPGLPTIDTRHIRIMGNSAGGEIALFSTALDTRIEAAIVSGCVGDWRTTSGRRMTCPDTVIPSVLNWMEYSDVLALCAPRPLLVVSGKDDHIYPFALALECVEHARPVYAALNSAHSLRAIAGPAGHRFYPEITWPAFFDLLNIKHDGTGL